MAGQLKRFTVSGWLQCGAFRGARDALVGLSRIFPTKINVDVMEFPTRDEYMGWLTENRTSLDAPTHRTSPLVWKRDENNNFESLIGGWDDAIAWAQKFVSVGNDTNNVEYNFVNDNMQPGTHEYDYDLIVVGGGSGGLATGREAAKFGAKVAILDYVKPSPAGSKWGLGGTCVNVGCIPKKLMHNAALLGEHNITSSAYGWNNTGTTGDVAGAATHDWATLRQNVQDHIKGLNFGYKVSLREDGITYHNKLGKFIDDHTIQCTDAKGKVTTMTAARFVIAVGGRPQPLGIPGGEHAITSDDIFMKKSPPGKTCVIGAGYVALECAGFLTALKGGDVHVCVRSILLRGFDREIVEVVETAMKHHGTVIKHGVLPTSIEKQDDNKLLVTFDDGSTDTYDTVLSARGRYMDLDGLGVSGTDSTVVLNHSKGGKLNCVNEQTNISHIYAVGDIIEGAPELTPSAIQAGRLLSRRLYDNSKTLMNYNHIATVVFTPLELGTVGLTEEEAREQYGDENVDVYFSKFQPLEWSVVQDYYDLRCMSKVIVDKSNNEKVLGMHIAAPNAGEIIQGFGVAFRNGKGLYYQDLLDTVGIHPTTAEEFTDMIITKSSGVDAEKKGC